MTNLGFGLLETHGTETQACTGLIKSDSLLNSTDTDMILTLKQNGSSFSNSAQLPSATDQHISLTSSRLAKTMPMAGMGGNHLTPGASPRRKNLSKVKGDCRQGFRCRHHGPAKSWRQAVLAIGVVIEYVRLLS